MGNTRVRPAIYNPATGTYTAAPALNTTALKSKHLATNVNPAAASTITTPPADIDMIDEDPEADTTAQPKPTLDEDRTFTVRKWVPVPAAEADKRPEPKYLADPRPGSKNIHGREQTANVNSTTEKAGTNVATVGAVANAAGEEISSTGLELSTVGEIGVRTSVSAPIAEPPRRRGPPPPPKRKKKGSSARRKKAQIDQTPGNQQGESVTGIDGAAEAAGTHSGMAGVKAEDADDTEAGTKDGEEDDGSGSDDGEEGSEEGEIDEGDFTMNTDVGAEANEPEGRAGGPAAGIAEVKREYDAPKAEVADVVALPSAEVGQVETAVPSSASQSIPPMASESASQAANEILPAAIVEERNTVQGAPVPAAPLDQPQAEALEVDLLGSLDRAVEGMQGAHADPMDTAEEGPAPQ